MSAAVRHITGQVPPCDLDAEAAVLSAIMLDPGAVDVAMSMLLPSAFYSVANRAIFEAAARLARSGRPIDVVSIASQLEHSKTLCIAGGKSYLAQLIDATPAITNLDMHCELVARKGRQREVISLAHTIAAEGYGDVGEVDEWLNTVGERVIQATGRYHRRSPAELKDIITDIWLDLERDEPDGSSLDRVGTGFTGYDDFSGGIYRGDLIVVAGRTGMGKSALAQCMARQVAAKGQHVLLFSVEMTRRQVCHRLLAQQARVELRKIRDRWQYPLTPAELSRVTKACHELARLPITIDDTPGIAMSELRAKVRRAAARLPSKGVSLGLVVVDYLQRLGRVRGAVTREQEVSSHSAALKEVALESHVPVVACAQLNRGLEGRPLRDGKGRIDRRPTLADLRESGAIEQDADQVVMIYRESYYSSSADPGEAELMIMKNRQGGGAGRVPIHWDGWCTSFTDRSET